MADILPIPDREEPASLIEPTRISEGSHHRVHLTELALELAALSAGLRRSVPQGVLVALSNLVRSMNCYYSNLIEGHDTHPIDIERALRNNYSTNSEKRSLQLEARAHITVQQWIDNGGLQSRATSQSGIYEIHRRFCELLPDDLLWIIDLDSKTRLRIVPGQARQRDVRVGRHIPVSPGAVPRMMAHFERAYSELGKAETLLAAAAAHHRLLWIHPFLDGNGRVARLMSYAMLQESLDTGGIWSVARGLARNVKSYKEHLSQCDLARRNDLDGRGNLSEEELASFTRFFLNTCLDQVKFMDSLIQPERLRARMIMWAEEETRIGTLPARAGQILEAILYRGELARGDIATLLGISDRQARRIVAGLSECGAIESSSSRAPIRLAFPARLAGRWLPGLFPEQDM